MTQLLIIADDLIWASRLRAAADRAGATSSAVRNSTELATRLGAAETSVIIDLGGRAYDGVALVAQATAGGARVLAVAQHDDLELRRAALSAGARRVLSYNKLFNDGPTVMTDFLSGRL